ncbi:MAG: SDR family NAD(P)-dependent oxidoreductase, partial [Christensenellales bacterium]
MFENELTALADMSNLYGSNPEFVLAGGGNTSYKNEDWLFVKGSGTALATIKPGEFVKMDRHALGAMWDKDYPAGEAEREAAVLADMMAARAPGENRRPSVETLLHELFAQRYVLHVHPAAINGITCAKGGAEAVARMFDPARTVWIPICKPGYILALNCRDAIKAKMAENGGIFPDILFLENHGIFVASDTTDGCGELLTSVYEKIHSYAEEKGCVPDVEPITDFNVDLAVRTAPILRMLYSDGTGEAVVRFACNRALLEYDTSTKSLSPDHIVYTKTSQLVLNTVTDLATVRAEYLCFRAEHGYAPRVVIVPGLGMFACGKDAKQAETVLEVFTDAVKICVYAKLFGGVKPMTDEMIDFIANWEVESYRSKVADAGAQKKRLDGKIAVITGGAQGFGKGIADAMAAEGANIVIADMNEGAAAKAAAEYGVRGYAVAANVTDEESVKNMIDRAVLAFGGLDIFVNNAGIAKAGSLEEMTKSTLELVTSVNYTGYFLCTK